MVWLILETERHPSVRLMWMPFVILNMVLGGVGLANLILYGNDGAFVSSKFTLPPTSKCYMHGDALPQVAIVRATFAFLHKDSFFTNLDRMLFCGQQSHCDGENVFCM